MDYSRAIKNFKSESCFHNINRAEAEAILKNSPESSLLIRPSSRGDNLYAMSINKEKFVFHVLVKLGYNGKVLVNNNIYHDWNQYKRLNLPDFITINK